MSGVLKIDIQESAEELKTLVAQQSNVVERSKLQILWWLKLKLATQVNELAQLSGYHRITIAGWLLRYRGRIRYWCEDETRVGLLSRGQPHRTTVARTQAHLSVDSL